MPNRFSIEVVEHSENDVRLIIKHGHETIREKCNSRHVALYLIKRSLYGDDYATWRR